MEVNVKGQGLYSRYDFATGAEWSILVLGLAKYSKKSNETQVQTDLPLPVQGLCVCLRSVVVSTTCVFVVDHAFIYRFIYSP